MVLDGEKPIFWQIAEGLEDGILSGAFPEESQIPSTTEISVQYRINPATVLKGINLLVDAGIVYKKRGIGMFVSQGAVEALQGKRREQFYAKYVRALVEEARRLNLTEQDVRQMLKRGFGHESD